MPDNTTNTNPSKLDVLLQPSDREIDYDKFGAEKQADIRGNVESGMIDHDAIADVEGAEAIRKILIGDEDLDTGLIEGKEALEIDTAAMRQSIINDDSYSAPEKNKYLRTMQIVESIDKSGFSLIRTDSGRYWIESKENGKREYAINAIQEVADLLDKYVVEEDTPTTPADDTPTTPDINDEIPGAIENVVPGNNTDIEDYVPEELEFSSSDIYYLTSLGVDLVSTMAGLGVKVTTTAPTAGVGYLGGAAVSIGGGIAATVLGAIGDAKNEDVTSGQMWGNILISLGLEAVEGVTSVPLGLTKNILKLAKPLKKLIRYGMAYGLVKTAESMEWDRLLSKEGDWTANDYRELATLGQFVLSGVSTYYAGRASKRVLGAEVDIKKNSNVGLSKKRRAAVKESPEFRKVTAETAEVNNKITAETTKAAKLRAKAETDVMDAEYAAKKSAAEADMQKEINKVKASTSKAKSPEGKKAFADKQAAKIEDITNTRRAEIAELEAEFTTSKKSSIDRHVDDALKSPEYASQLKENKTAARNRRKELVSSLDETKAMKANKDIVATKKDNYEAAYGVRQRNEAEAEIYSDQYMRKQKAIPAGTPKKEAKLIAKKRKADAAEYGKKKAGEDAEQRKVDEGNAKKEAAAEKKANTKAEKLISKQRTDFAKLEAKKATDTGLTSAEQAEYNKLKTSIDKYNANAAKPTGKIAEYGEKAGKKVESLGKIGGSKVQNAGSWVQRNMGVGSDQLSSSSMAKVYKQEMAYGSNATGDRIDKLDLQGARKRAEELGFRKNEIGRYTLRQLQAAIKARMKEDVETKRTGGKLIQKFRKAGVIPVSKPAQTMLKSTPLIRKFQGGEKIEEAKTMTDEEVKGIAIRIMDNYNFDDVRQLDNFVTSKIPPGVALTPEQSAVLTEAYKSKVAELGTEAKIELSKTNPMDKWRPLLQNIRPSDLFIKNKIFTEVPVRKDVNAPVLRARPESNLPSYRGAISSTYKHPRIDSGDSMLSNLMKLRFANAGARKRQEINASNDAAREQQKREANAVTNQNIAGAVQAQNQNKLAYNQASDTYAQERVKARAAQQSLRNKQLGHVGNSLQRAGVQMVDQRAKKELGKKINSLAGLRQIYATEYAPLVDAAVKANNPFKATVIKQSFMDKHKRNPDMLNVDILNLSDEMKLFDT